MKSLLSCYGFYRTVCVGSKHYSNRRKINSMLKTKAKYPVLHPTYNGNHFDECITKKQIRELKKYLEDPNREIFEEEDLDE